MTCREKLKIEYPKCVGNMYHGGAKDCPSTYGYLDDPAEGCERALCEECWDREIPEEFAYKHTSEPLGKVESVTDNKEGGISVRCIKDSGTRREFETGAVRDIQEGKGRCDLMPLGVVADLASDQVLKNIYLFQFHNDTIRLEMALKEFILNYTEWCPDGYYASQGVANMVLEVSKHFEEGAKKYGEYNWQKGIPVNCYIDSAVRHYVKWLRGDTDEPHDRAFCWNILCCIWTCQHKPELNPYAKKSEELN